MQLIPVSRLSLSIAPCVTGGRREMETKVVSGKDRLSLSNKSSCAHAFRIKNVHQCAILLCQNVSLTLSIWSGKALR